MGASTTEKKSDSLNGSNDPEVLTPRDPNEVECPAHTTERRLMAKIDGRVIPFLCIMYLLAFLDRVNISNANVYGLSRDLGLISDKDPDSMKFNTAIVIFFVPYCLLEIPSNILLKKFNPNVWLSINMFFFGFTTICQGLVNNYSGLLATRFFLGVFETGMFPGAFYLIGMWYKRSEAQKRFSFFFSSTTLAGAFGGLLAAAIGKMSGLRGYAGWRWIFILEGALTVFASFFFYFLLPNFPEDVKWLDKEEREYVKARLEADVGRSAAERPITIRDVGNFFKDFKVIAAGVSYFGLVVSAYGYAYFAPGIIKDFHYSAVQTQLRSVPPWAAAFGFSMLLAYLSDKTRHRFSYMMFSIVIAIVGFAILVAVHDNRDVQYGALFLVTSGTYTAMPILVCWFNMNLGGHHRRSIGSAWQIGFGNLAGIVSAFSFLNRDKPKYIPGYSICLSFSIVAIVAGIAYFVGCYSANKQRRTPEGQAQSESLTEAEKEELGDMSPEYYYLL